MKSDGSILLEFLATAALHAAFWLVAALGGAVFGVAISLALIEVFGVASAKASLIGWTQAVVFVFFALRLLYKWRAKRKAVDS